MTRFKEGVAAEIAAYIAGRHGAKFTSLDVRAALPHLNWSSVRTHLHWMGRTGRLQVWRQEGKKARTYQAWPDGQPLKQPRLAVAGKRPTSALLHLLIGKKRT